LEEFVDLVGGGEFVHRRAFSYQPSAISYQLDRRSYDSFLFLR
jgi:hypothetical protein